MKKIMTLHVGLILAIILSFACLMFIGTRPSSGQSPKRTQYAARQELKKVRRTVDKQLQSNKKAQVQQRRQRILQNGNINNFYPPAYKVRWIIINNKAYLVFWHYSAHYGHYQRYMRVT